MSRRKRNRKRKIKIGNKGFSLVEILAVIVIIGILSSMGVVAYSRYKDKAIRNDVDALALSSLNAFQEYLMDHPNETSVFSSKLVSEEYMSSDIDPYSRNDTCTIRAEISNTDTNKGTGANLDSNNYVVYVCCSNRTQNYTYTYGSGQNVSVVKNGSGSKGCQAGYDVDKLYSESNSSLNHQISDTSPEVVSHSVKKKNISIYTMSVKSKDCENKNGIKYPYCLNKSCTSQFKDRIYKPYRSYDYYTYPCSCYYNKADGGYAGYTLRNNGSGHNMMVFYKDDQNGINSCQTDDLSQFNKYVDHICTWGIFWDGATSIEFHGYRWYSGNSGDYGSFDPSGYWYHDEEPYEWKAPKEPGESGEMGCAKTCLYMTPYWGGKKS